MPSNEQRRQAAKRKLERQLQRRAEQAKRRRMITIGTTIVVVAAVVVGVFYVTRSGDRPSSASPEQSPQTSSGPCAYTGTPGEPAAKPVGMPPDPNPTPAGGVAHVTMDTSQGAIPLTLDRAKAPCTVQSFQHLVQAKFFDNTDCHRLTTTEGLKVLQCGDPTASGRGGPGYSIKDEPPKGLAPAPAPYDQGGAVVYPRGTLAMAKSSAPNSGGSQFFMVYGDSYLPPQYTAFGTIGEDGLKVLDKVAAAGAQQGEMGPGDGKPNLPVHINTASSAA